MATFAELIQGEQPVLVDFWADWCGPCHMLKPVLEQLADEMGERIRIVKVDVDRNPMAAQAFQVQSIPTLILFHKGEIAWRGAGYMPAPQLKAILNKHIPAESVS